MASVGCGLDYDATLGTGTGGGGELAVEATYDALATATGSGDRAFVTQEGAVFTDVSLARGAGSDHWWLPDYAIRKSDGTLYTLAYDTDASANKMLLKPSVAIPGAWIASGAVTDTGTTIDVERYIYAESNGTASRLLLAFMVAELPAGTSATTNVGVLAGQTVGGTSRTTGIIFEANTDPAPTSIGRFGTDTGAKGTANLGLDRPIFLLIDLTAADAPTTVRSHTDPGAALTTERADLASVTPWFEVMAMDSGGSAVGPIKLKWAFVVRMT